jgi:hypothetical protein
MKGIVPQHNVTMHGINTSLPWGAVTLAGFLVCVFCHQLTSI